MTVKPFGKERLCMGGLQSFPCFSSQNASHCLIILKSTFAGSMSRTLWPIPLNPSVYSAKHPKLCADCGTLVNKKRSWIRVDYGSPARLNHPAPLFVRENDLQTRHSKGLSGCDTPADLGWSTYSIYLSRCRFVHRASLLRLKRMPGTTGISRLAEWPLACQSRLLGFGILFRTNDLRRCR